MFFKTDTERATAQAAKARHDAGEAGANAASGARNLGAAVVATLAEVTAPADDKGGRRHAKKAKAKALKAAAKDRDALAKSAGKARGHSRQAAQHIGSVAGERGGAVAERAGRAGDTLRHQSTGAAHAVRDRSAPLAGAAAERAGAGAALLAALAAAARDKAEQTRARTVSGVDHGIDLAVPRAQHGVAAVGSGVDSLRDVINDELLPKLQAMLGDVQTGKDRVLAKDDGVIAAVTGAPKARKHGGPLIVLGVLAAAGAGFAWWLSQQQKAPARDPWASPTEASDPWAGHGPAVSAPAVAPVPADTEGDPVATTTEAEVDAAPATATPTGDGATAEAPTGVRMLATEEIDDLASEDATPISEQGEPETDRDAQQRD